MSRLSSSDKDTPEERRANSTEAVGHCNGAAGESVKTDAGDALTDAPGSQGSSANQETSAGAETHDASSLDRVEELMDQIGKKVGSFASTLGKNLFRLGAHAREAAEDCWAEAQSIRRGEPQQEHQEESPPTS
jgi:hypothetical protein